MAKVVAKIGDYELAKVFRWGGMLTHIVLKNGKEIGQYAPNLKSEFALKYFKQEAPKGKFRFESIKEDSPCWDGYKQIGMKMKNGKEVPNCVKESVNEENVPNNPALWSRAKAAAKAKFDVYPSAYANGWASKWYKEKGGTWKTKSESVNEADVVGKTIFSDGKGKLFFGYYKTDDAVEFVDYKTWKKLSFKDVSKGDTNKDRVVNAILKNQKQFNKKVDYNMWYKKNNPSFEEKMDWFIQNGWISNITKGGIKEQLTEANIGDFEIGDFIHLKSKNKTGMVIKISGNKVTINTYTGPVTGDIKDVHVLYQDNVNEAISSKDMETIKSAVEAASSFMSVGTELKKTGMRYIFATSPMPIYVVQDKSGNRVAIVNKKYASKPDFLVGDIAVGIMEVMMSKKSVVEGNVNEAGIDVDLYRDKQSWVIGPKFAKVASDSDIELMVRLKRVNDDHAWQLKQNIKSMDYLYKKYKIRSKKGIEESVSDESNTNDPSEGLTEGNAFTGALFKARQEGLTEFEFNGKMYPVKKLDEENDEEKLDENKKLNVLKTIIKEEYHAIKSFMEQNGIEIGKLYSNPQAKSFVKEEEEEVVDEYDVENYEETEDFKEYIESYMKSERAGLREMKFKSAGVKELLTTIFNHKELLPKLGFKSFKDVLSYIKFGDQEEQNELESKLKSLGVQVPVFESKLEEINLASAGVKEILKQLYTDKKLVQYLGFKDFKGAVSFIKGGSLSDFEEIRDDIQNYKKRLGEAEYQGRKVKLGKIMQGDVKKFKVYVKNDKGNVVKVNFGQGGDAKGGTMRIRKNNPEARASFRARHNCDNPGPRWKARYWSCKKW